MHGLQIFKSLRFLMAQLVVVGVCFVPLSVYSKSLDDLNYLNTQNHYAQRVVEWLKREPIFVPKNWKELIHVDAPPKNSSQETAQELKFLLKLQKEKRTKKTIEQIRLERDFRAHGKYGEFYLREFFVEEDNPLKTLFIVTYNDTFAIFFHYKEKFNRVRPEFLETDIKPLVYTPLHPAYPSGHSTIAYMMALLLAEFEPSQKDVFIKDAIRVAHNREIAGVHYPSDSEAGRKLSVQIFELLKKDERYQELLKKAKAYWIEKNVSQHKTLLR